MIPLLWKRTLQSIKRTQAVFRLSSTLPPTDYKEILNPVSTSTSPDPFLSKYGDFPTSQTISTVSGKTWTHLRDLSELFIGQKVWLRARVHNTRIKGKGGFLILRESGHTTQCTLFVGNAISKEMVKYVSSIAMESVVDVLGVCKSPQVPIAKCSQKHVEVEVEEVHVVSRAETTLPLQIQDASGPITLADEEISDQKQDNVSSPDERKRAKVSLKTRLDNRVLDLRTPASQAILQLNSTISHLYRAFLSTQGFTEIHTPKLLPGSSEGGADVFKVNYFGRESCLAQSPQLYKQMALMADLDRVYEVGPVFRAEDSNTHRHLCEFTGLDLEMTIKDNYFELTNLIQDLFIHIFAGVGRKHEREIAAVREQFQFIEPFKYTQKPVIFTFLEATRYLSDAGVTQSPNEDFTTDHEKKLGEIVREKFGTDFYIVHRYPSSVRPFYTLPCPDDPAYTCSFDVFMRGEEILSGGQRVHDAKVLEQRIREKGMEVESLRDYVNSFKYGAFPHGGCGIGLERVVMLYLGLKNIRRVSMFPRDPKRLSP